MKYLCELSLDKILNKQNKSGINIQLSQEELILLRLEQEEEKFKQLVGKKNLDFFYNNFTYQQLRQLYNL